jgi:hypothetical protein
MLLKTWCHGRADIRSNYWCSYHEIFGKGAKLANIRHSQITGHHNEIWDWLCTYIHYTGKVCRNHSQNTSMTNTTRRIYKPRSQHQHVTAFAITDTNTTHANMAATKFTNRSLLVTSATNPTQQNAEPVQSWNALPTRRGFISKSE